MKQVKRIISIVILNIIRKGKKVIAFATISSLIVAFAIFGGIFDVVAGYIPVENNGIELSEDFNNSVTLFKNGTKMEQEIISSKLIELPQEPRKGIKSITISDTNSFVGGVLTVKPDVSKQDLEILLFTN